MKTISDLIRREDAIDAIMGISIPLIAFGKTAKIYLKVKQDAVRQIEALPSADRPTKVVAQITFDEEKLREIVKGAVERFKEEYKLAEASTIEEGE